MTYKEKKEVCKRLNAVARDWTNGKALITAIEEVRAMGYDVRARGNPNPINTYGSYPCSWSMVDSILECAGKWRFTNFEIRRRPYTKGEIDYTNSREYGEWLKHF